MKLFFTAILLTSFLLNGFGQTQKKVAFYVTTQFNQTLYDITRGNNQSGFGAGGQLFFNNTSHFKPSIELTADLYLLDDKVYRLRPDNSSYDVVRGMINLLGGFSYQPGTNFNAGVSAGPSFVAGKTLFGIKPAIGFFFGKNQRMMGKFSYLNVFDRDKETGKDFGAISLGIGLRLL
ncbi:MAG: hypothetical protein V4717_12980 [Bacteroidota bacterium]